MQLSNSLPASSSTLSALERATFFRSRSTATATQRAYATDLREFARWGGLLPGWGGRDPRDATPPEQLEIYLAEHGDKLKISSLRRRVAAINRWNAARNCATPGRDERVRTQLAGIARAQRQSRVDAGRFRVRRAPPILAHHMKALLDHLERELAGRSARKLRAARDRALFLLAWSLGTRRSELLSLQVTDLLVDSSGLDVHLGATKADQEGEGVTLGIPRVAGRACAVASLEAWLSAAAIGGGPLFRGVLRGGGVAAGALSCERFNRTIKQRLAAAGVAGAHLYSAHSFRAGMITQGLEDGAPAIAVQERSRHRSHDVFIGYVRRRPAKAGSFVAPMLEKL